MPWLLTSETSLTSVLVAGIVPVLADRAMAPRDSAVSHRPRGWTQTDSSEEMIVFQGNRSEHPTRQPVNAPSDSHSQKAEGFANFLKTHSSPNHNRVTAGGRIVPMEKRPAPPQFQLGVSREKPSTGSSPKHMIQPVPQSVNDDMNRFADRLNGNNDNNGPTKTKELNTSSLPSAISPQLLNIQQAALESNLFMQNQLLSYGQGNGSLYPTVPGIGFQGPLLGQQYPANLPFLQQIDPFAQLNISSAGLPIAWYSDPQVLSTLQTMLTEANQSFEMYDQQLKDLDKYRATHPREDGLVRQRMDIVASRASVKEDIRRFQAAIKLRENAPQAATLSHSWSPASYQTHGTHQFSLPALSAQPITIKEPTAFSDAMPKHKHKHAISSKLNVKASEYVPKVNTQTCGPALSQYSTLHADLPMPNIPAVKYSRIDAGSPELKATDAWGERVGPVPTNLLREQSLLAENILSELNSSKGSDDDSSDNKSAQSVRFAIEPSSSAGFHSPGIELDQTARPPASVEADYEKQMDAMRKPNGSTTRVVLADGQAQVVPGLDLKPPEPEHMTNFERQYWSRKSAYSDYIGYGTQENSAKTSTVSFDNPVLSRDQSKPYRGSLQDSPSRQILSELSSSMNNNPNLMASRSREEEWDVAIEKLQTEAARRAANGSGPGVIRKSQYVLDQEAFANKTFSSTSVQNIHANSHIPRSLDGAVEANLRRMNSPGKSSNKTKSPKSPKTILRSAGDAWFGPFRRNFYETKLKGEEDDVAHFGRVR